MNASFKEVYHKQDCKILVSICYYRLRSVCLLIDGKVGIKKNDLIAVEMLDEFATPYQVRGQGLEKLS